MIKNKQVEFNLNFGGFYESIHSYKIDDSIADFYDKDIEDILIYAPLLQNNAFNFTDLMDVTDIEDKEFYKLKEILREVKLKDQK